MPHKALSYSFSSPVTSLSHGDKCTTIIEMYFLEKQQSYDFGTITAHTLKLGEGTAWNAWGVWNTNMLLSLFTFVLNPLFPKVSHTWHADSLSNVECQVQIMAI